MANGISVLGFEISWYSILGFAGLAAAVILCVLRRKRYGIPADDIVNLAGYAIVGILVGSKLLALACSAPDVIRNWDKIPWSAEIIELFLRTGFVYYGGLVGVIVMFYIYSRQFEISFGNITEMLAPAIPCFHMFGRIGCYIAGCCYGIGHFPLQLAEAAMNLIIFTAIIVLQNKNIARGKTFLIYMFAYGAGRFILEFFRGDMERGFVGPLSVSQWISIAVIAVAAFIWKRGKNSD